MKKTLTCTLLCLLICSISFGAVRKNWKVTKNAITILKGQTIEVAQHIYGTPNQIIPPKKDKVIYIWGSEGGKLQGVQTKTISSDKNSTSQSVLDYGYNCYIALKVDVNGIITDGIQVGFEPDRLSPGCRDIFIRSHQFCKAVTKETEKQQNIFIRSCYRYDLSQWKHIDFVIPQKYQNAYYYQEDHDINNFFND